MRKTITLCVTVLTLLLIMEVGDMVYDIGKRIEQPPPERVETELTEWQIFVMALAEVESEYETQVVNPKVNATGLLQITSMYINEANRIVGEKRYCMKDSKDPVRSIEIFHMVNGGRNPDLSITKAIKLHNPNAGQWYEKRIRQEMERFKVREQVRKELIKNY